MTLDATNAQRSRRARARQKYGKAILSVETELVPLVEALIREGLLDRAKQEDRLAIHAALNRVVEIFVFDAEENYR